MPQTTTIFLERLQRIADRVRLSAPVRKVREFLRSDFAKTYLTFDRKIIGVAIWTGASAIARTYFDVDLASFLNGLDGNADGGFLNWSNLEYQGFIAAAVYYLVGEDEDEEIATDLAEGITPDDELA